MCGVLLFSPGGTMVQYGEYFRFPTARNRSGSGNRGSSADRSDGADAAGGGEGECGDGIGLFRVCDSFLDRSSGCAHLSLLLFQTSTEINPNSYGRKQSKRDSRVFEASRAL